MPKRLYGRFKLKRTLYKECATSLKDTINTGQDLEKQCFKGGKGTKNI